LSREKPLPDKFIGGVLTGIVFPNGGIGIAQLYPLWDKDKGEITQILVYMSFTSRGRSIDVNFRRTTREP
jgi:hypothetical protein